MLSDYNLNVIYQLSLCFYSVLVSVMMMLFFELYYTWFFFYLTLSSLLCSRHGDSCC